MPVGTFAFVTGENLANRAERATKTLEHFRENGSGLFEVHRLHNGEVHLVGYTSDPPNTVTGKPFEEGVLYLSAVPGSGRAFFVSLSFEDVREANLVDGVLQIRPKRAN